MAKLELISSGQLTILNEWLDLKSALEGLSTNTLVAYKRDLIDFFTFLTLHHGSKNGVSQLESIDQAAIRSWIAESRRSGR